VSDEWWVSAKRQYYGMYMFVINWMNKLLRHEQEQALLHNIIETEKVRMLIRYNIKELKWSEVSERPKGSTMVCTCLLSTEWTNFWGMNKNKNKHCCTTSSKSKSSISSLSFRYLPCLMINKELVNTHLSTLKIQIWLEMIKISQVDLTSRLKLRPWHWSSIMVSLRNNGHAKCLIKLLDQGTLKSMVVNSEDVLNLTAGRSYSAGGHNLHFSTRILKHVQILTPDTNSEARANSDILHEFWSTCKFWHLNVKAAVLARANSDTTIICSLSLLRPLPKSGPLYNMKKIEWLKWAPKGSTMVCTCLLSTEWTNFW